MILDFFILLLFVIFFIFIIFIFIFSIEKSFKLPKYCFFFGIYSIIINVLGSIFIFLNCLNIINIPIFRGFVSIIHYEDFLSAILSFSSALFFSILLLYKGIQKVTDMEARFALDLMNPKLLFIDNQLERKEISERRSFCTKK